MCWSETTYKSWSIYSYFVILRIYSNILNRIKGAIFRYTAHTMVILEIVSRAKVWMPKSMKTDHKWKKHLQTSVLITIEMTCILFFMYFHFLIFSCHQVDYIQSNLIKFKNRKSLSSFYFSVHCTVHCVMMCLLLHFHNLISQSIFPCTTYLENWTEIRLADEHWMPHKMCMCT